MSSTATTYILINIFGLYMFVMGMIAGMSIIEHKDEIKYSNATLKVLLVLMILLWPISCFLGWVLEKAESGPVADPDPRF